MSLECILKDLKWLIFQVLNYVCVGLLNDFDLSGPEPEGVDQDSAFPLASKGKRTKARSGKVNSKRECKASGVGLRSTSKPTPSVSKCDPVGGDKDSHSLKTRSKHTRRSSLPSVGTDSEFRVYTKSGTFSSS